MNALRLIRKPDHSRVNYGNKAFETTFKCDQDIRARQPFIGACSGNQREGVPHLAVAAAVAEKGAKDGGGRSLNPA